MMNCFEYVYNSLGSLIDHNNNNNSNNNNNNNNYYYYYYYYYRLLHTNSGTLRCACVVIFIVDGKKS